MLRLLAYTFLTAFVILFFSASTTGPAGTPARFSILFAGDILLANEAGLYIKKEGTAYPFLKIKDEFCKYDFIFANLESPVTENGEPTVAKPYVFRISDATAACIKDLKLDVVSTANNHMMDYGADGLADTLIYLEKMNIRHAGAGATLAEARRPALLDYRGTGIVILAYNERPPAAFWASEHSPGTAPLDINLIREDIATYRRNGAIVIVSLHWGIEQTSEPQPYQIPLAHAIIDCGADAVIGHHPHWPQGIEMYHGKPIVYSLGNFINGYVNRIEQDNIAIVLYYNGSDLECIRVLPIAGRNHLTHFQPRVLSGEEADNLLRSIQGLSYKLNTDIIIHNHYGVIDPYRKASSVVKQ